MSPGSAGSGRRLIGWLADQIVDRPRLTLVWLLAVTVVAFIGQTQPDWLRWPTPAAVPEQVPVVPEADGPAPPPPPDVAPIRVARGDVILLAESDEFFTPEGAAAIRAAVEAVESLDHVRDVFWLDRAPPLNLFALAEPILPEGTASAARFEAARRRANEHPLVHGQLMSPDGTALLLMVRIDWLYVRSDDDATDRLRDTAEAAAEKFPGVEIDFSVTGNVPIQLSRSASNRRNEIKYQLIGYATALAIALVLFRGLAAVLVVASAPAAGVFWTLGCLHLVGLDDNAFNAVILPVLLCMVGFTDGVHMMVQIRRRRAAGASPREASKAAIREVGLACWFTSLTTAIGFGSLMLAHEPVVREFGMCCVIGVLLTFLSVISIIPWASATRLGRRIHAGHDTNMIDRGLERISVVVEGVLGRAGAVSVLAVVCTAALAVAAAQLEPDERLTSSLDAGSEAAAALHRIDRAFGGMETAEVHVDWSPSVPEGSGEIAAVVAAADRALRAEPLIGHPLSIVSLLRALPGEGDPASRMSLLELLPPPLKRAYIIPEAHTATVQFRIQDLGIARYGPVFERVQQRLREIEAEHPAFRLQLAGGAIWRWQQLYQVVVDLATSLGTASVIIFFVLTLTFRSLRLGLISVIPNLFPLVATGTLMLLAGQHLEIVSVCAFTVCLGIAVDDTIHFLTRFREEQQRGLEKTEAIRRSFIGVGSALLMTTLVLVVGFSTALLSEARDHRIFATMGILTIGTALLADLVFLPALLQRFGRDTPGAARETGATVRLSGDRALPTAAGQQAAADETAGQTQ